MVKPLGTSFLKIILVGIFAVVANAAVMIFDYRWDVTKLRSHTLTAETQAFLSRIDQPIKLTVFYSDQPPRYLKDLLARYEDASGGLITSEIIDPLVNLSYAARFGTAINKDDTKVFLRSGDKSADVDFTGETLTQDLLNFGILRLNRGVKTACFTAGHNEYKLNSDEPEGLKKFKNRLAEQDIQSREIVLGIHPQISDTCDVLVIAGPHNHFTQDEEKAVTDYLKHGGDALVLVENTVVTTPDAPLSKEQEDLNPSLDGILNPWGLRVGKDIVVDISSHISGDPGTPATRNYMNHPALVKNLDYTFYVRPRSISLLSHQSPEIKQAPFVLSSSKESSWAETNRMLEVKFDPGTDIPGPAVMACVAWGLRPNPESSDTRIALFTDADFLSNAFIEKFSNGQMAMNVMNWLIDLDLENDLTSKDHQQDVERLDLTSAQKVRVGLLLAVMPLMILCLGIFVWLRRRS